MIKVTKFVENWLNGFRLTEKKPGKGQLARSKLVGLKVTKFPEDQSNRFLRYLAKTLGEGAFCPPPPVHIGLEGFMYTFNSTFWVKFYSPGTSVNTVLHFYQYCA